jgi:hypothetical protein
MMGVTGKWYNFDKRIAYTKSSFLEENESEEHAVLERDIGRGNVWVYHFDAENKKREIPQNHNFGG